MKIKITCANRTQQTNAITKARAFGATARDNNYGPIAGKESIVINTKLGNGTPALQLSDTNFTPTKNPYDDVITYKDFMNSSVCPWDSSATLSQQDDVVGANPEPQVEVVHVPIPVPVPVETGACSQETMKVTSCNVVEQESIAWNTLGLKFIKDGGIDVTMDDGTAYILNTRKNTAKKLTAASAAKKAKKDLLAGKDSVWVMYGRHFDLFTEVTLTKVIESDD